MQSPRDWRANLLRRVARFCVKRYYAPWRIDGADLVSRNQGVLLCANHANSLLDPVVIGIAVRRDVHFLAKAPLFDIPVLGSLMKGLGMIPAYRGSDDRRQVGKNVESLSKAAVALARGGAVGIFPEGRSHDLPVVEQVRSGAARLAIDAAQRTDHPLTLVPMGLNYEDKTRFRTAVWVRIGQPIELDSERARDPAQEKAYRRELTQQLTEALREVVIQIEVPEWCDRFEAVESLSPGPRWPRTGLAALKRRKTIADAMNACHRSNPQATAAVAEDVASYLDRVHELGLREKDVILHRTGWRLAAAVLGRLFWYTLGFPIALLGTVLHGVPFPIVRALARKAQDRKLRTDWSLYRLLFGIPVYAFWYLVLFLATFLWMGVQPALLAVGLLPWLGLFAYEYMPRFRTACEQGRRQLGVWWSEPRFAELVAQRESLGKKLQQIHQEQLDSTGEQAS